jgi:Xaa-Pro dipeptidase
VAGQDAIRSAIGPDRTAEDVYRSWRACVDAALGVPNPRHHCGYLIGIGFPPSWVGGSAVLGLRPGNHTVLRPGMAFYIQSWVIKQRVGDHVVSDTVLVTDTGCEPLTTTPRN